MIDLNLCVVDEKLDFILSELAEALDIGCHKVMIDVRGNPGGNSEACSLILNELGMSVPASTMICRYSSFAIEQRGYEEKEGLKTYKESTKEEKTNNPIELVILSDKYTFSSATLLCTWVRDGKLGKIIGEASSNQPSAYGDILKFTLENSKLEIGISHKKFIRPNQSKKENRYRNFCRDCISERNSIFTITKIIFSERKGDITEDHAWYLREKYLNMERV